MSSKNMPVRSIKKVFKKGFSKTGLLFTQIERTDFVALYKITSINKKVEMGYEVFLIKFDKKSDFLKEYYPRDEDFGKTAFSYGTLNMAKWGFEKLNKEKQNGK